MKKSLHIATAIIILSPMSAFAETTSGPVVVPSTTTVANVEAAIGAEKAQAAISNGKITVVSPRTGISYTFPDVRPVVLQTTEIAPATQETVKRIVASNPALSTASQEQAKQALVGLGQ